MRADVGEGARRAAELASTRQLSSSGARASPGGRCRGRRRTARSPARAPARAPRAPSGSSGRRTARRPGGSPRRRAPRAARAPRVERQRLLADDVLAGGERGCGERHVQVVGRADVDDVDVRVGDERLGRRRTPARRRAAPRPPRRSGGEAATPTTRPPARRRGRGRGRAPMNPVPAMPTRSSSDMAGNLCRLFPDVKHKFGVNDVSVEVAESSSRTARGFRDSREHARARCLRLIRAGDAVTRAALARQTGLARSTVAQRVDALLGTGSSTRPATAPSTGGRPPRRSPSTTAPASCCAPTSAPPTRAWRSATWRGRRSPSAPASSTSRSGPSGARRGHERASRAARRRPRRPRDVRGIGVGVPGPVAFATGRPVSPPIMPGWDGFSIPDWFADRYDAPGPRRQRREHHGPGRALGPLARRRAPPLRQGRHRHRLRHRRRR